jgi:hypothetical protein
MDDFPSGFPKKRPRDETRQRKKLDIVHAGDTLGELRIVRWFCKRRLHAEADILDSRPVLPVQCEIFVPIVRVDFFSMAASGFASEFLAEEMAAIHVKQPCLSTRAFFSGKAALRRGTKEGAFLFWQGEGI